MNSAEKRLSGILPSLLSGLLLALAFPRADQGWLALVALVPLLRAIAGATPARAARRGFAFGAAYFVLLLPWLISVMHRFGGLPFPVAIAILALFVAYLASYFALFAALFAAAVRRWGWIGWGLAPPFWVALELLRERLLTGFPWGSIGYTQWRNLPLLQVSAVGGVYAVSFLVVTTNAALGLLTVRTSPNRARGAALAGLALVAAAQGGGVIFLRSQDRAASAPGAGMLSVAAIQANVPQDRKWRPGEEQAIVDDLMAMTERAAQAGARIVVWPESASPLSFYVPDRLASADGPKFVITPRRDFLFAVTDLARRGGITLVAGSVDYRLDEGRLRAYNSAFAITPDGTVGVPYDKAHLVPFGEYVPLQRVLFFVDGMVEGAIAAFAPGKSPHALSTPYGSAGTFVCYEAIFPELVRPLAWEGAFLVNITNDAWFGKSGAPGQHLAMAVFRAAENRRYLLRAANTGISALVDPFGRVVKATVLNEKIVLRGELRPLSGHTFYARTGDLLAWACAIVTFLSAAALCAAFLRPGRNLWRGGRDGDAPIVRA